MICVMIIIGFHHEGEGVSMFNVAICDDSAAICSELENITLNYVTMSAIKSDISVFCSAEELYTEIKNGIRFDLVFLDIVLDKMTGVELGNRIRTEFKDDFVQIVYISSHSQYCMELFKIRPFNFLLKPLNRCEVVECIHKVLQLNQCKGELLYFKSDGVDYRIQIYQIIYIKRDGRALEIYTTDNKCRVYDSLENLYHNLKDYYFFYCHQSYLIHYTYIREISFNYFILTGNIKVPISQKKRKDVKLQIESYRKGGGSYF